MVGLKKKEPGWENEGREREVMFCLVALALTWFSEKSPHLTGHFFHLPNTQLFL